MDIKWKELSPGGTVIGQIGEKIPMETVAVLRPVDGYWETIVAFEGRDYYCGKFSSEFQAKGIASVRLDAILNSFVKSQLKKHDHK